MAQARADLRKATMREYRRLLYVALTRAEERLYIAGFYNTREPPEECWGAMIDRAFADKTEEVEAFWGEGDVIRRIVTPGAVTAIASGLRPSLEQRDLGLTPDWLRRPVEAPARAAPLRPSRVRPQADRAEGERGRVYGTAMHLLLQHLPMQAAAQREAAARTFLTARHATIPAGLHEHLISEAMAVIALPEIAALFSPDARAEVAVAGALARSDGSLRDVRGAVDRLVVTPERVIVADFKTGEPESPPPRAYLEQVALYRRALAPLWPDRPIDMMLVWTRTPELVKLDPAALDAVATAILTSA